MSKSLESFTSWAIRAKQVSNPTVNTYPGQCVSLIQEYLSQVFGIPYAKRGNAKDFVPPTFQQLPAGTQRRPGDIIRYGKNYGGGYGHIGYIDHLGRFIDQNGTAAMHVGVRLQPFAGINAVFRPTRGFKVKNVIIPVPPAKPAYPRNVTVTEDAYVRNAPKLSAPLSGSRKLKPKDVFTSVGLVPGSSVRGNNLWHKSTKGNYIWSGNTNVRS